MGSKTEKCRNKRSRDSLLACAVVNNKHQTFETREHTLHEPPDLSKQASELGIALLDCLRPLQFLQPF